MFGISMKYDIRVTLDTQTLPPAPKLAYSTHLCRLGTLIL